MVPNITRGHNFGRLTEYLTEHELETRVFGPLAEYLVEPKEGKSERVGFIELVNFLPGEASTPKEAARVMALTAANASQLKRAAGVAMTGKKVTSAPVWHLSLSWTPGEKVDRAEMMKAADGALRSVSLGFKKGYQTIIVEHIDTEHPHIHLQVNLVHPVTGKQANPWKDRERLQVWAHRYDKARGNEFCRYRAWKYEGHQLESKPARTPNTKNRAERAAEKAVKQFNWAMNEAAALRWSFKEKINTISAQNVAEFEARKQAKDALWQDYQSKRTEVKAAYDEKIRDHYRHRKQREARGRQPKGPTHLKQSPQWRGLNRRLRVEKDHFYKREMAPLQKGDRAWRFNQAAKGNPFKERDKIVRAVVEQSVSGRNKVYPIRMAMNAELAALSLAYTFQCQRLKVRDAMEKLAARARWRDLSKERTQAWDEFRKKHGLEDRQPNVDLEQPQRHQRGSSGINHLAPKFNPEAEPRELEDATELAAQFKLIADIQQRFAEVRAEREAHAAQTSDEPTSLEDSIRDRFNSIRKEREEQREQGWKLRGKDRAPRNRGRGGLDNT